MQSTTRLKLGPKRKDSHAFHRLNKKAQNGTELQNLLQNRLTELNISESMTVHKNAKTNQNSQIKTPRSILIQLNTTSTGHSLEKANYLSYSNALNNQQEQKQSIETPQVDKKYIELQSNNAELQKQNEQLKIENEKNMKQKQQLLIKQKQMEQKIIKLNQQNQKLKNNQKILKVEINNFNKDHYEQQITRLKSQCQKLQIQTIEKGYKQKMAEDSARQAQNQINKKNQEIKILQKAFEKQKMGGVEARSKINEKDRCLKIAFEQSQAANQFLCKNIEELTKQIQRQQKLRKQKDSHIDSLNIQINTLINRQKNNEAKMLQMKKTYEDYISEQNKKFATYQQEQTDKHRESETLIIRLSSDIQTLKNEHNERLVTSNISNESQKNQLIRQKQLYIVRLEQQIKQVKGQVEGRDKLIRSMQEKLKQYYSPEQYTNLQKRYKQLEQKRLTSARYYEQKLYNYQKQNDKLRLQKINKAPQIDSENGSFDYILKQTMEESNVLRSQLKRMSDSLTSYKQEASQIRLRQKNYLNELQILRKKSETSSKNFEIELQVEKQKLVNEIQSLRRKLSTVETRLQYKISENKQKDDFIKSVIVGKSQISQRSAVLAELERIFLERDRQQSVNPT